MTAVIVAVLGLGAGATSAEPQRFTHYVALGDSYTSGPLIPLQRLDPVGCGRSTNNYPARLAARIGLAHYTDVSCGGATTANMITPQSVLLGVNGPQFNALSAETDLVTLGIGGNDYQVFGNAVNVCPTLRASDPTGAPCQRHFTVNGVDTLRASIDKTQQNVINVLTGVHQRSPKAEVLVVGYPRIAPPAGYCPDILPFADGDYRYLDSIEQALDNALATAAKTAGAVYVDTYGPSLGHDACAPDGAAWINGRSLSPVALTYHPFESGMAAEAAIIAKVLAGP
ncbi:MAG: SGNH/GDSL hydrolase family protein [Kutzneria sp.]|nr:SGNH/GDSL hydrolase family protein [Kutzneria sp.]